MRRLILLALLGILTGLTPAQKAAREQSCDQLITQQGPTLWLDAEYGITESASAVSAWASRVGAVSFTQATAGNKPAITRRDNRENRLIASGTLASASATRATWSDPVLTDDGSAATTHYVNQAGGAIVAGARYRICARVKLKERHASLRLDASAGLDAGYAHFNLTTCALHSVTGNVGSATATADADYCIICAEETATAAGNSYPSVYMASTAGTVSYNGDSTSGLYIDWISWQDSLADLAYQATTTYAEYRGMNGRRAVRFDGGDSLSSTTAASAVFGASAKTIFKTIRPFNVATGLNRWTISINGNLSPGVNTNSYLSFSHTDGGWDTITSPAVAVANNTYAVSLWHDGVSLYGQSNGSMWTPAASGPSASMVGTLMVGGDGETQFFSGEIENVLFFNKVLPSDIRAKINRCLCRKAGASC